MKAQEMFENLGWVKKHEMPTNITYVRGCYRTISFVSLANQRIVMASGNIDMVLLKAINKQCQELGWI